MSLDRLMAICQQKGWGLEVTCIDYRHYVAVTDNGQKILTATYPDLAHAVGLVLRGVEPAKATARAKNNKEAASQMRREVYRLHFQEGLKPTKIARNLGITFHQAQNAIYADMYAAEREEFLASIGGQK